MSELLFNTCMLKHITIRKNNTLYGPKPHDHLEIRLNNQMTFVSQKKQNLAEIKTFCATSNKIKTNNIMRK